MQNRWLAEEEWRWHVKRVWRMLESWSDRLNRQSIWLQILLSGSLLSVWFSLSERKLLWYDEILTWQMSALPLHRMWQALSSGIDLQPPLFYLVTLFSRSLLPDGEAALRVPALVGIIVTILCLFAFVAPRLGTLFGAGAALFVMVALALDYSYEARPYGLTLGAASAAMLCWQRTWDGRHRTWALIGLWFSLACAVSFQYFAVFTAVPLLLGETVRALKSKRIDIPVVTSVVLGVGVVAVYLPLVLNGPKTFSSFHPPGIGTVVSRFLPYFLEGQGINVASLGGVAIPFFLACVALVLLPRDQGSFADRPPGFTAPEIAVALGFMVNPLVALVAARIAHIFVYQPRYVMPFILGAAILAMAALWRLEGSTVAGLIVTVAFLVFFFINAGANLRAEAPRQPVAMMPTVPDPALAGLPIVVSWGLPFLQCFRYCSADVRSRLLFLGEPDIAREVVPNDSTTKNLTVAAPFFALPVVSLPALRQKHSTILVACDYAVDCWVRDYALKIGSTVEFVSSREDRELLLVHLP